MSPFNKYEVSGRIYYDQNEERIAIKEEVISGDEKDYYQDFAFYKQVSLQTHWCKRLTMKGGTLTCNWEITHKWLTM